MHYFLDRWGEIVLGRKVGGCMAKWRRNAAAQIGLAWPPAQKPVGRPSRQGYYEEAIVESLNQLKLSDGVTKEVPRASKLRTFKV